MSLTVAAIGAVMAALLESTILPHLQIAGVQPDLVLIVAVVWTFVARFEGAIVWAFVGGLMLDVLAARPLGSTAFALLVCVGAASGLARVLEPLRLAGPAVATFIVAILYAVLFIVTYGALRSPLPLDDPLAAILPRAIYDTVIGGLLGAAAMWFRTRRPPRERLDW